MGAMTLRNLDPRVGEVLRRHARQEGRSLNGLICEILAREAGELQRRERMREQRAAARALRGRILRRHGTGTPAEKLLRQDRRR